MMIVKCLVLVILCVPLSAPKDAQGHKHSFMMILVQEVVWKACLSVADTCMLRHTMPQGLLHAQLINALTRLRSTVLM